MRRQGLGLGVAARIFHAKLPTRLYCFFRKLPRNDFLSNITVIHYFEYLHFTIHTTLQTDHQTFIHFLKTSFSSSNNFISTKTILSSSSSDFIIKLQFLASVPYANYFYIRRNQSQYSALIIEESFIPDAKLIKTINPLASNTLH